MMADGHDLGWTFNLHATTNPHQDSSKHWGNIKSPTAFIVFSKRHRQRVVNEIAESL